MAKLVQKRGEVLRSCTYNDEAVRPYVVDGEAVRPRGKVLQPQADAGEANDILPSTMRPRDHVVRYNNIVQTTARLHCHTPRCYGLS